MEEIDNGGSAFPWKDIVTVSHGMTLRDWFAGQVESGGQCPHNQYQHEECAKWCYERADAMIKAREAKEQEK